MEDYRACSHTLWGCKFHKVQVTKYRYTPLSGDVGERVRELLREMSWAHEMMICAGSVNRDHMHMLIALPPHLSVSASRAVFEGQECAQATERICGLARALMACAIGWHQASL
jgi:putative transposase